MKEVAKKTIKMDASAKPVGAPRTPESNKKLLTRIEELTAETLAHPQVTNKSEEGVASRVARILNKEGVPCTAHRFWTGAHVLMVSIPTK